MIAQRLLLTLYTASGAAALVYEVVWMRLLTLQLGHPVAAASTGLTPLLGGLALGAYTAGRFLIRRIEPTDPTLSCAKTRPRRIARQIGAFDAIAGGSYPASRPNLMAHAVESGAHCTAPASRAGLRHG